MKATLFFDMDGTLIDSAVGITRCITYALQRLDAPVPDDAELRRWIGPSLRESFGPLLQDPGRVEQAVSYYRERFEDIGYSEHTLYDGIGEAIAALAARGHRVSVVTAKNEPHARRIVDLFDFREHFDTVVGATVCGRISHKPQLIGEALARLALDAHECTMIGDRRMDVEGAHHHGMRAVGVLWGFGSEEELAAAEVRVRRPADLLSAALS
jgi:phosphoglycolate phosphatase